MDLSHRQRRAIAILLETDREVTLGAIAEALDVSPRTVHRELSRLGPFLEPWGLAVKGRSGQGVQVVGEVHRLEAFRNSWDGAPGRVLTAADRRWMGATLVLESPVSVKFFALERELGVGTSVIRTELDHLQDWLDPFDLRVVRRRGFGVAVEGPEFQKRLALGAALAARFDEAELLGLFRNPGTQERGGAAEAFLFERFPRQTVARVDELVNQASGRESWDWAPFAGLSLTLNLVTALQRVRSGLVLDSVPPTGGDRGPATRLLASLSEAFRVDFPPTEVDWVTLLLEASKPNRAPSKAAAPDLVRGVLDLVRSATQRAGFPFDKDPVLIEGLAAHWGPALARLAHRLPIANALLSEIRARFPDLMQVVSGALFEVYPRLAVPLEEVGYLVLHFAASVERRHREAEPFRALIVCSSGIGTSQMLASRIRAEVPEIEVVANLSWFDVKDFSRDRYDLLISTIPLPLPEGDYVVVSPLLDDVGRRAIRDHMRLRRLKLMAGEAPARAPSLGDLRAWTQSLGTLIEVVEALRVFEGRPGVPWAAAVSADLVEAGVIPSGTVLEGLAPSPGPLVVPHPGATSSLSLHPWSGGWLALVVHPLEGFSAGPAALSVLVEGLSSPEARAALALGHETELRAVLARTLGRNLGPKAPQGDNHGPT